jgi:probable aminopeptidase NPEPL1
VDTPTADLTTADFVREAKKIVRGLPNVTSKVIIGDALAKQGLGGVYGVGKAAAVAPRMLILDYKPARAKRTVALVGKGVVYDTGGLHIKGRGSMESMKGDMGGAAAVIGAFRVLAASKAKVRVIAITPLAENSVDANSYRPDDILTMHSGHTVEINNTDAEGRLLLGDAVSWAARKVKPDVIIDIATLTGAQLIATGKSHAAVVSDRDGLQDLACEVGRATGELCFPLLFCPEFHHREFKSQVADMKNSVKDRMNAQSSCAAWFVWSHIDDLTVPWLHIDIAGPGWRDDRGTGFGVGLLAGLAESIRAEHLA